MPRRSKSAAEKVEENPFRESEETEQAKPEERTGLDYSAGGIDNATDIVTAEVPRPGHHALDIIPGESTRQKD